MLKFYDSVTAAVRGRDVIAYCAPAPHFTKKHHEKVFSKEQWNLLKIAFEDTESGSSGATVISLTGEKQPKQVIAVILPEKVSRHNTPTRKEMAYLKIKEAINGDDPLIVFGLDDPSHYPAMVHAICRHLLPARQKGEKTDKKTIHIVALNRQGKVIAPTIEAKAAAKTIPWVCDVVDRPPSDITPESYAQAIKGVFRSHKNISIKEIVGEKLLHEKLGGIHAVGKAADSAPRLLLLDYHPKGAKRTVALVGKGVTYDTGGLSLKISGSMVGMKGDMAGSAAVIGALGYLVETNFKHRVIACVGLVENAIGPGSYKNDDIIRMHSGKTVEINNTDAEGRLVLSDCLSYVCRKYQPDLVMDAATLTGAQLVATGLLHAGLVSSDGPLEKLAVKIGQQTGDLVAPLPFAPEIFQDEFASDLADMKNSVKNRMNAQSSCAAQFIYSHIADCKPVWAHIDLAGPASSAKGLATGYGVLLMAEIARAWK